MEELELAIGVAVEGPRFLGGSALRPAPSSRTALRLRLAAAAAATGQGYTQALSIPCGVEQGAC